MSDTYTYIIDRDHRIVSVDEAFLCFAGENAAPELTQDFLLGKSLFDFMANAETRHLYELLIDKARAENRPLRVSFRCDSPELRRFMELQIVPSDDGCVHFISRLLRSEARPPVDLLDIDLPRTDEIVVQCGWCKRIRVEDDWEEVEAAIERLRLFDSTELPSLSHGICTACRDRVVQKLELPFSPDSEVAN